MMNNFLHNQNILHPLFLKETDLFLIWQGFYQLRWNGTRWKNISWTGALGQACIPNKQEHISTFHFIMNRRCVILFSIVYKLALEPLSMKFFFNLVSMNPFLRHFASFRGEFSMHCIGSSCFFVMLIYDGGWKIFIILFALTNWWLTMQLTVFLLVQTPPGWC